MCGTLAHPSDTRNGQQINLVAPVAKPPRHMGVRQEDRRPDES
jgi:hypothetical protein